MRLIVTRPAEQAARWVLELRSLGVDAQPLPLLAIAPLADASPLRQGWQDLAGCALAMFVSANAVQHFCAARPDGLAWPAGTLAGSTGPGTSAALRAAGVPEANLVEPAADAPAFDSEALWARLAARDWAGRRVLIVRGEDGRDWLAETLRVRGAEPRFLAAYRRLAPVPDAAGAALLQAALAAPRDHAWLLSSSEAVQHLLQLAPGADWSASLALATHPRIAATARGAGFGRVGDVAPTPADVARALVGLADPAGMGGARSIQSGSQ
ncbi:Uroporphyrinogen-III synthase [Rubrivivax sp. A210]|uniref:uroporphyrinogen-III synthase n=1 Tax=Rubrivivax sp. A210 TaxID=2772301 RepID=UPI001917FB9D|nr:uroporphyrinogen-III synthase [Rubrivivax sp. A210]CAD5372358.1 Uroporphyrinogen-III synthase [Rubrivivax sp. A210]